MANPFFVKLDRALRWFLPQAEAREVLRDYQEMQQQAAEAGEAFPPEEEKPRAIARALRNPREYYIWLAAFGLMLLCPLLAALYYLTDEFIYLLPWGHPPAGLTKFLFWLSLIVALLWVRRCQKQEGVAPRCPRAGWLSLGFILISGIGGALACYWIYALYFHREIMEWLTGQFIFNHIWLLCALAILASVTGLINCRLQNYRWLGLHILGITLLLGAMIYLEHVCGMYFEPEFAHMSIEALQSYIPHLICGLAISLKIQL